MRKAFDTTEIYEDHYEFWSLVDDLFDGYIEWCEKNEKKPSDDDIKRIIDSFETEMNFNMETYLREQLGG